MPRPTRTVTVDADLEWEVRPTSTPGRLSVSCDGLGIRVEAHDEAEIPGLIDESVDMLMRDLHEDGELASYLSERGLRASRIPVRTARNVSFVCPWHLVRAAA